jgi:hypothetical protein
MKTTLKIMMLLLVSATLGSCVKDADDMQHLDPGTNNLYFINSHVAMTCQFEPPFEDHYSIVAKSGGLFGSTYIFRFEDIPYEMLGRVVDLTEKSDLTLHFEFHNRLEWNASPDGVSGSFTEAGTHIKTEYPPDESPFESGKMYLTEDENGITFILRGVLQNGKPIRMELFAPAEK